MKLIRYGLLPALVALHNYACAWEISSSDAVAPSAPLNDHETLAKTWTIAGDKKLDKLSVFTFGRVFVEYDSSLASAANSAARVAAKVVFSGDNGDLLDAFEVTGDAESENAVSVRLRNMDIDTKGYLLTRVYVSDKQAVNTLAQALSADVVVGEDVMLQNDRAHNVTLASIGSGSVYFGSPSTQLSLANLTVSVVGSGDVQVVAKSVDLSSALNLIVAGSGDAAVVANDITVKDTLVVAIAGSGDTFVQSEHITTTKLSTVIAGSGSATYSRAGVCQDQEIAIVGSGDVAVGSIQCVNTNVSLAGSGDVVVQTSGNLSVTSLFGSGDVRYFGAKPSVINVEKSLDFFGRGKKQKVKPAKKNHYEEYEVQAAPTMELTYFEIKVSKSSFGSDEPAIHELIEIDPSTNFAVYHAQNIQMNAAPGQAGHSTHALGIFALVGVAFAVVGVAAVDYKRRNERARYQSLV